MKIAKYSKYFWYFFIPVLWVAIFLVQIVPNETQISAPDEYPRVMLKTQPVDPRDILRGDFVALRYDFSRPKITLFNREVNSESSENSIDLTRLADTLEDTKQGTPIFLILETKNTVATLKDFSFTKPTEGLFLKGEVIGKDRWKEIRCGIERFYVPQGKGWEIEDFQRDSEKTVYAEIALNPETGKGIITDLLLKKTPENSEPNPIDFSEIDPEVRGW
jgi:uncharacterized membrane-anchored protein